MSAPWAPDWSALEPVASSLLASNPLAARIATVSPVGGHVALDLQVGLAQGLGGAAAAPGLTGPLVIAVDTLTVPEGRTVIMAPAVSIVARAVQVANGGSATLMVQSDGQPGLQLVTASISGTLSVGFQTAAGAGTGTPAALALSGERTPQVLTASAAGPPSASAAQAAVADAMHPPWAIVAMELSAAVAGVVLDQGTDESTAFAGSMLRWTVAGCSALLANQGSYSTVDFTNLASLQTTSIGLLAFTQAATSGAIYVPVLSSDLYQQEVNALLAVAGTYDNKITGLQNEQNVDQALQAFATTLNGVYTAAESPLLSSLRQLANQSATVESQLQNAAVQLNQVSATLGPLQKQLVDAINEQFQQELVKTALDTFFTVVTLYIGCAAVLLGDPEILAGNATAVAKAAMEIAEKLIEAGEKTIDTAISEGAESAGEAPSAGAAAGTAAGAQYLTGSVAQFGQAVNLLWALVDKATSGTRVELSPDLLAVVDKVPDLSGFSVGGLDPVTYWQAVVVQTQAAVKPNAALPEATAYLEAVQLAVTYGTAVGDLQMKLLDLYTQGLAAFDRLQEVYLAEDQWNALSGSLQASADKLAAAIGLLQRGYLAIKRNLVVAVENYRAAFLYQWLSPPSTSVDPSMDLATLQQEVADAVSGLEHVLAGTASGVRPRQSFQGVTYTVQQDGLFVEVGGQGQAQWSIPVGDPGLTGQLSGNTALFLESATFQLIGAEQDAEVELDVSTSGHYGNQLGATPFRFVSKPVSMTNNYQPGPPLTFVTQWQFADPAAYLAPSPYTNWVLRVVEGNWKDVTSILMTLSGKMLQNP